MKDFKPVKTKLRVYHFPQVPCNKPFHIEVEDEKEATRVIHILAQQHLHLYKHNFIPDYSNIISCEMWDSNTDEDGKEYGWGNYWNEEMMMEWEQVEELFDKPVTTTK